MAERRFTLLYDGECPFCRREVEWLRRRDREDRLSLEDIADPGIDPAQYGLTQEDVCARHLAYTRPWGSCPAGSPM